MNGCHPLCLCAGGKLLTWAFCGVLLSSDDRRTAPRFALVVMNRLNDENFVQHVDGAFEFDIRDPYLIFRAKAVRSAHVRPGLIQFGCSCAHQRLHILEGFIFKLCD